MSFVYEADMETEDAPLPTWSKHTPDNPNNNSNSDIMSDIMDNRAAPSSPSDIGLPKSQLDEDNCDDRKENLSQKSNYEESPTQIASLSATEREEREEREEKDEGREEVRDMCAHVCTSCDHVCQYIVPVYSNPYFAPRCNRSPHYLR